MIKENGSRDVLGSVDWIGTGSSAIQVLMGWEEKEDLRESRSVWC